MSPEAPAILVLWESVVGEILDRTVRFPKASRFTFAQRIDGRALDVLEALVDARYARAEQKRAALIRVDRLLAQLRVLVRLSHQRQLLDHGSYELLARRFDEVGRMLGGWVRTLPDATNPGRRG